MAPPPARRLAVIRSRRRTVAAVSAVMAGLVSCAPRPAAEAPPPPAPPAPEPEIPAAAQAPSAVPVVTLLDPGRPPFSTLRIQSRAGTTQSLILRSRVAPLREGPEGPVPQDVPWLAALVDVVVVGPPGGDPRVRWTVRRVDMTSTEGMPAEAVAALSRGLESIAGSHAEGALDPRNAGPQPVVSLPEGAGGRASAAVQRLATLLHQQLVPLPEEPVGVGAAWRARLQVREDDFRVDVATTWTVVSVSGEEVRLKGRIERSAPRQLVKNPGGLPDAEAELLRLMGEGSADVTLDLRLPWPRTATSHGASSQAFVLLMGDLKRPVLQEAETTVEIAPAPAD